MASWKRWIGVVLSVGMLSEVVYYIYKKIKRKTQEKKNVFQEVLFFPDKAIPCKAFFQARNGCQVTNCHFAHYETGLGKLLGYIQKAERTIDVCVFCISCHELADAVIQAHKRDVVVRVITDNEQMGVTGSQIGKFRNKGIQVRHDYSSFLMHHKFVIIDGALLISGSFNWTRCAVTGNHENIIITSDSNLVTPFKEEFERLWELFEPAKYLNVV
ncbi:uncharacterized protein [Ptychodera flava]|uniref:uncharacterized protein n=1 Tax=Ptychodera flava TaxID=63121 RepID=UPI00396A75CC